MKSLDDPFIVEVSLFRPRGGLSLLSVNLCSALATSLVCPITRQIVFFLVSFSYSQGQQRVASIIKRVTKHYSCT